jgi:hypothetical protein
MGIAFEALDHLEIEVVDPGRVTPESSPPLGAGL